METKLLSPSVPLIHIEYVVD